MNKYFRTRIMAMQFKRRARINIRGLAIGIDVGSESYASKIGGRCRRRGLLVSAEDTSLLLLPALTIDQAAAQKGLDA